MTKGIEKDSKRLKKWCMDILRDVSNMTKILNTHTDEEIVENWPNISALKYALIRVAEAISDILLHLLARLEGKAPETYIGAVEEAEKSGIIPGDISKNLRLFFRFRNMLIHRYWDVDDRLLVRNLRKGLKDFERFVELIEERFISPAEENKENNDLKPPEP